MSIIVALLFPAAVKYNETHMIHELIGNMKQDEKTYIKHMLIIALMIYMLDNMGLNMKNKFGFEKWNSK